MSVAAGPDQRSQARAILLLGIAAFGVAFALACFQIVDYDIWYHLAWGRELVTRGVPLNSDPFTLGSAGMRFDNHEWLFGVIVYGVWRVAGLTGVTFFKALVAGLVFFVLHRDAQHRGRSLVISFFVVWLAAFAAQARFYERPEILMMLFVALDALLLDRFLRRGGRAVLLIPVVELLWANLHGSAIVGPLLVGAWLLGSLALSGLARLLGSRPEWALDRRRAGWLALVLVATLAASCCSPCGIAALRDAVRFVLPHLGLGANPADAAGEMASMLKHQIAELQPFRIQSLLHPYVVILLLALAALPLSMLARALRAEGRLRSRLAATLDPDLVRFALGGAAALLTFSAVRFHALATILLAPAIARALAEVIPPLLDTLLGVVRDRLPRLTRKLVPGARLLALAGLAFASPPLAGKEALARGFGVAPDRFPEGAVQYLLRRDVKGPLLNTYHFGGYLEWRAFPRLRPLIDGRGLVSPKLLQDVGTLSLLALERSHGIQAAILEFPALDPAQGEALARGIEFFTRPADWVIVYWDDVSFVMVRDKGPNAAIARADGLRAFDPFGDYYNWFSPRFLEPSVRRAIAAEVARLGAAAPGQFKPALVSAKLALFEGDYGKAESLARQVRTGLRPFLRQYREYRLFSSLVLADVAERRGRTHDAIGYLQEVLAINPHRKGVLYRLAVLFELGGRTDDAIEYYGRALLFNPGLADGSQRLARLLRARGDEAGARIAEKAGATAQRRMAGESTFYDGVRLYREGKLERAMEAFRASLQKNPASAPALSNLGYVLYDLGLTDQALTYQLRAVEIDPGFANAHYGLALIHRSKGNTEQARYHLRQYLSLVPRGPYSRNAEKMLAQLAR